MNKTYFFGVGGLQNWGLLTDPSLSAAISPAHRGADALVPFELSSGLLMVAVLGAMAVARGRQGQKTMSKSELEIGASPLPRETARELPGQAAGVFSHEIHVHEQPETPKESAS